VSSDAGWFPQPGGLGPAAGLQGTNVQKHTGWWSIARSVVIFTAAITIFKHCTSLDVMNTYRWPKSKKEF